MFVSKWVSEWGQVSFQWDDDDVCFVLYQHAELDFYIASSPKIEAQWSEPMSFTFHSALRKLNTDRTFYRCSHQSSAHLAKQFQRRRFLEIGQSIYEFWRVFLTFFAASGNELYIFRQCTKLSNCLKRAETSVILIVFDCVLCEVRAYKFISL